MQYRLQYGGDKTDIFASSPINIPANTPPCPDRLSSRVSLPINRTFRRKSPIHVAQNRFHTECSIDVSIHSEFDGDWFKTRNSISRFRQDSSLSFLPICGHIKGPLVPT